MRIPSLLLLAAAAALADDGGVPRFSGKLCQGFHEGRITGVTDRFTSDHFAVCLAIECTPPPAAGHRISMRIVDAAGTVVCPGDSPLATDPQQGVYGTGFFLAGRPWAREGGSFRMQAFWDDGTEPIADIPFTVAAGRRHALLIGIQDYPDDHLDLPGIGLAVERMRSLLVDGFGIPAGQVTVLRDLEATRANIEKEILALAERAGPEDAAILFYTAHGCQVPDLDGDEEDGWDEAICPADPQPPIVTTEEQMRIFLTDDRLRELLRSFKTRNVTVIFDSCHSGTAVREAEAVLPPAGTVYAFERDIAFGRSLRDRAEEARGKGPKPTDEGWDRDEGLVFLSACRPWEVAKGVWNGGFFTNNLIDALAEADGASWEQIADRARQRIWLTVTTQSPTVEGGSRRLPFSLVEAKEGGPWVRPSIAADGAVPAEGEQNFLAEGSAGTHLALLAGYDSLYKEQVGATFDVYPAGETAFRGAAKARVVLTGRLLQQGKAMASTATIESGAVHEGDRLVPRTVRMPAARPRVAPNIGPEAAKVPALVTLFTAIEAAMKGDGRVEFVTQGRWADMDYVLEPRIIQEKPVLIVWSSGGMLVGLFEGDGSEAARKARDFIVERHDRATRIVRLQNPSPSFRLDVSVEGGGKARRRGEPFRLRATAGEAAWFYLLASDEEGNLTLAASSPTALAAGEVFAGEVKPERRSKAPAMFKLFATTKPLDLSGIPKAAPSVRAEILFGALAKAFGSGDAKFLSTEGWSAWLHCEN
jgi:hypothetical protein